MDDEMEYMENFVIDEFSCPEIDPDYEFDACQFFDFTRDETEAEEEEAERWFRYAREYPPSPFIVKLKMAKASKGIPAEVHTTSSQKMEASENASASCISEDDVDRKASSTEGKNKGAQDFVKAEPKSAVKLSKPKGSTLMKPTASHLAKQNKARDVHASSRGRSQRPLVKAGGKLQTPGHDIDATKRQKLEVGYLRKVAQLKHQTSFSHKIAKKVGQSEASANNKSKTTVPRTPELVTAERAQRHRLKSKGESGQQAKANIHAFKALPVNRKISEARSSPLCKKSIPHVTECQEFHLKTTQRAMQHQSANVPKVHSSTEDAAIKRQNSGNVLKKEKHESPNKFKVCAPYKIHPIKDGDYILNVQQDIDLPPIELFKKLSLKAESETKTMSLSKPNHPNKASKENVPTPFQHEYWRCAGKPNQCGRDRRIPEVRSQMRVDIR